MTNALIAAAQAVIDRWDTPAWKDVEHTAVFINRLRAALTTAAGAVKESLTAAHALPPGIARDDTAHGEMYYTVEQVRAMLAHAAPQPAVQQGDATRAAARALSDRVAEMCNVDKEDHWKYHSDDVLSDAELVISTYLAARAPADSVLEDAARWQALPAFFEEYQIDAMKLYRDIDAYLAAARKQGANQ